MKTKTSIVYFSISGSLGSEDKKKRAQFRVFVYVTIHSSGGRGLTNNANVEPFSHSNKS